MPDNTPAPRNIVDDPAKPYKAYATVAMAFIVVVATAWINDDGGTTSKEIVSWIISALIASGLTGGTAFAVANPKVIAPPKPLGERGYGALELLIGLVVLVIVIVVLVRLV